jgi:hypothetical protein
MQIKVPISLMFEIANRLQQVLTKDYDSIDIQLQEALNGSTDEIRRKEAEKLFQELVPKDKYPHVDDMSFS